MRRAFPWVGGVGLLLVGYVLGSLQLFTPTAIFAQGTKGATASDGGVKIDLMDETQTKIRAAADAMRSAADALANEQKYQPATKGMNTFAILSGGRNTVDDLENGAIVDPETYSALYADLATDTVAVHLGRDSENRLTYKGKVIRIYPVQFLQSRYLLRSMLTGEELSPSPANSNRTKTKAKTEDDSDQ
ncbi:MAG: hypothetical protein NT069_09445 [Planctomycetota bacterium]|nr:hypothetical protein [Planctomycetota bacterium]